MATKPSPFSEHAELVLKGQYSTAQWLKNLVLSLWNGRLYPIGMSGLGRCDARHAAIAVSFIQHYAEHGEADEAFMRLARTLADTADA